MNQNDRHWSWATPRVDGMAAAQSAQPPLLPPILTRRDRLKSAIVDRLPPTLRGRGAMDRTTGIVLAVSVLLGALLIGGWAVLRAKPHEMSVARERPLGAVPGAPEAGSVPSIPVATSSGSGSGAASGSGRASGSGVIVDVEGKVAKPGVRTLPAGSRILDALNAAGGALPGTDLTALNQAQILVDGEQVLVGVTPPPPPSAAPGHGKGKKSRGGTELVHLNLATAEDLEQLPGVGPALAERIVDYRTAHGPFHSVDELRQVSGFGGQRFDNLASMVAL
jgi:competence protein ComEA